jgi:hypothetical protein
VGSAFLVFDDVMLADGQDRARLRPFLPFTLGHHEPHLVADAEVYEGGVDDANARFDGFGGFDAAKVI